MQQTNEGERQPHLLTRTGSPAATESRVRETDSETRSLAAGNYYGAHLERNVLALDWSKLRRAGCGREAGGNAGTHEAFARTPDEAALECPRCGKKSAVPRACAPDLVADRRRRIAIEIHGKRSGVRDATEMEFHRTNGFTAVTVPNEVAGKAESSEPVFQLLALVCRSDHPERLFAPESGQHAKELIASARVREKKTRFGRASRGCHDPRREESHLDAR
jgi:hypothetical protein